MAIPLTATKGGITLGFQYLLRPTQPFPGSSIDKAAAEPHKRQSCQKPRGVTPARLLAVRRSRHYRSLPVEGMAMTIGVEPSAGKINWLIGRVRRPAKGAFGNSRTTLLLLAVLATVGLLTWTMRFGRSDAQGQSAVARSAVMASAQNTSLLTPEISPTEATQAKPADASVPAEAAPAEVAPVDGLKISSQSWRRGGLGSKALVTFTLRNGNDYAVRDIEISCAFARRDGSRPTNRKRLIHDTVNMKSRKVFARLHVGFVNINAEKAKCALIAASPA
jgi:hypothetical protein